jgi:hypothetical protein
MNKILRLSALHKVQKLAASDRALRLLPGQVLSIEHGKGRRIRCTAGHLWVTLEHCPSDYILEPEQSLEIGENGRIVISALDSGDFKVA